MNDFNIDKLFTNCSTEIGPNNRFKEQVLLNSTNALTQSRILRKRLRIVTSALIILLLTTAAFLGGRLSNPVAQIASQQLTDTDHTITVSKDLVAWLDTARFFTQLNMTDRAANAYKQAGQLIPTESTEQRQTQLQNPTSWASALKHTTGPDYLNAINKLNLSKPISLPQQRSKKTSSILSMTTPQYYLGD